MDALYCTAQHNTAQHRTAHDPCLCLLHSLCSVRVDLMHDRSTYAAYRHRASGGVRRVRAVRVRTVELLFEANHDEAKKGDLKQYCLSIPLLFLVLSPEGRRSLEAPHMAGDEPVERRSCRCRIVCSFPYSPMTTRDGGVDSTGSTVSTVSTIFHRMPSYKVRHLCCAHKP
jgi:hypothetical protein